MSNIEIKNIEELLLDVYDPEFPMIDVFTLGLIYNIDFQYDKKYIHILMTLTSPACPMADLIISLVKEAIQEKYQNFEIKIEITFDPLWNPDMIRDEDLKKMFM